MNLLKNIFGRLWAIWGLLLFVATMALFFIPFLLFIYTQPDPIKSRRFVRYSGIWMDIYLPLIGCPLKITGREFFTPGANYIVLCNHNALMDVPVSTPATPGGNKTIAKIEMDKVPVFNLLYRTGAILVDRKSDKSRKESYLKMKDVLNMGLHMCIYPEGTRNKTDQPLKSFHDGAFRLALETRKSIMPSVIVFTKVVMPNDKVFFLWPHRLEIAFLPPIHVGSDDTIETLKQRSFVAMEKEYVRRFNRS
jgi:1-acyl-sn-glycerol-3-phosphate acyltransferase